MGEEVFPGYEEYKIELNNYMSFKLITDSQFDEKDFTVIKESANDGKKHYYISGPYMAANMKNRNKRKYILDEMIEEVARFDRDYIKKGRAMAELNHPQSPDINPERASDLILELKQDGNVFMGKSRVLNTPVGKIVQTLLEDGVQLGKSTRCLGLISEDYSDGDDTKLVRKMKLITVDTVGDPSFGDAWVNGILENRSFAIDYNPKLEPVFEKFDKQISKLPNSAKDLYIRECVLSLINQLGKK